MARFLTKFRHHGRFALSGGFLPRNSRAFAPGLGETDCDCLFAAFHFSTFARLQRAALSAPHSARYGFARAFAVLSPA